MKHRSAGFFLSIMLTLFSVNIKAQTTADNAGKDLFKIHCTACHSIGKGKMVGPDLLNIKDKRAESWLIKWIKSSQSLIKSGDADAIAIFEEFNKTPMTDFSSLSDDQIKSIIGYINEASKASASVTATSAVAATNVPTGNSGAGVSSLVYLFGGLVIVLLFVIIYLSRVIIRLSDGLADHFDNDRSFFKKW